MRLAAELASHETIILPIHYNHAVQGLIYRLLSRELRDYLHEHGFVTGTRRFKLFTFSRIIGRFVRNGSLLLFKSPVKIYISSPVERFIRELANGLLAASGKVRLNGNELRIVSLEFPDKPQISEKLQVTTLSPITVYSTLHTADGKRKTYYYSPYEEEFSNLISENLMKKTALLRGNSISGRVEVKPIKTPRERICMFKGTIIRCWTGAFMLAGEKELIEVAYETGLGSKNSAGFGMIEVANHDRLAG